jgi:hypothetical protein
MSHVETCIKRMLAAFPPPTHLRGRPDAIEQTLETYRQGLARFDRETLDKAWLKVAQEHRFWNWPMLSEIVKAAESLRPRVKPDDGWVERVTTREDEYVRRFMQTTQAAVRAREVGYEAELKRYVQAVAHVQAQFIEGRKDIGYSSGVLFPGRVRDKEAEDEWFARQKEQGATGSIRVRVPLALVERWKDGAQKGHVR